MHPSQPASHAHSADSSRTTSRRRRRHHHPHPPAPGTATSVTSAESASHAPDADDASASAESEKHSGYLLEIKRTYRAICTLEAQASASVAQPAREARLADQVARAAQQVGLHKRLAALHVQFLEQCFGPGSLASWRSLPSEYGMTARMWQVVFDALLEQMLLLAHKQLLDGPQLQPHDGRSDPASDPPTAPARRSHTTPCLDAHVFPFPSLAETLLEHIADFVYFGYRLYSELVESELLHSLRTHFRESLGDLARARLVLLGLEAQMGAHVHGQGVRNPIRNPYRNPNPAHDGPPETVPAPHRTFPPAEEDSVHERASIGAEALEDWNLDEAEVWRTTAYDWYVLALSDIPGTGRLHHHIALLLREKGDDLCTMYHLSKALIAVHPYAPAREPLLEKCSPQSQLARRNRRFDGISSFIWLHGALVRHDGMEHFDEVLEQVLTWLASHMIEPATQLRMLGINLAALLEYGSQDSMLAQLCDKTSQDADIPLPAPPTPVTYALRLAFGMLYSLLSLQREQGEEDCPSAYVTGMLTFVHTTLTFPRAARLIEPYVPWTLLAQLSYALPLGLPDPSRPGAEGKAARKAAALASKTRGASKIGSSPPLPEDWAMRGMGWIGRQVYERGFWTLPPPLPPGLSARKVRHATWPAALRFKTEHDALHYSDPFLWDPATEEEEPGSSHASTLSAHSLASRVSSGLSFPSGLTVGDVVAQVRWTRLGHLLASLARFVPGFEQIGTHLMLRPPLTEKIEQWSNAPSPTPPATTSLSMETVASTEGEVTEEKNEKDAIEIRHRLLRQILTANKVNRKGQHSQLAAPQPPGPRVEKRLTTLLLDTNVLLVSPAPASRDLPHADQEADEETWLTYFVRTGWRVVVPLAVVTELDGLTRSHTPKTARGAQRALIEIEDLLKMGKVQVQTSRFTFLPDLATRSETIDFGPLPSFDLPRARTLDDIILRLAIWHAHTPVDTNTQPATSSASSPQGAADVPAAVLLTHDTNLRLKARAYGIEPATPFQIASE